MKANFVIKKVEDCKHPAVIEVCNFDSLNQVMTLFWHKKQHITKCSNSVGCWIIKYKIFEPCKK
jgi:hypothetical protein